MAVKDRDEELVLIEEDLQWDEEERVTDLSPVELHATVAGAYLTSSMKTVIDDDADRLVTHLRASTNKETQSIVFQAATPSTKNAKRIRFNKTHNNGYIGIGVQLRKIGVQLLKDRIYIFPVTRVRLRDGSIGYKISFGNHKTKPRQVGDAKPPNPTSGEEQQEQ